MYQLHIANKNYSSWSLRAWVLMKTLAIDFEEIRHYFEQDNYGQFKVFSPSAKVPVLVDGGIIVWDSLPIAEFLYESYKYVWPDDRFARAWARSATAEMHSSYHALRTQCPMSVGVIAKLRQLTPELAKDIYRLDELFLSGLDQFGGPFLAGEKFSAVDAFYCPVAFRIKNYGLSLNERSQNYIETLLSLPSMQVWKSEALAECERDPMEEAQLAQYACVISDLRQK